jgi:hypothetical protein
MHYLDNAHFDALKSLQSRQYDQKNISPQHCALHGNTPFLNIALQEQVDALSNRQIHSYMSRALDKCMIEQPLINMVLQC